MAQEVQKVFPEFVSEREGGYLGITYSSFSVVAIKAIQEQQKTIESQQQQINQLQAQIEEIKNLLKKIISRCCHIHHQTKIICTVIWV